MKLCSRIKFLQAIDHQKDVTQKVAKAKTVLPKDELTLTAKTKTKPDVNKNESAEKAIDHQKDVTQKVAKAKTKPDVNKNESAEKVTVISYYFGRGQVYMLFF
jgi:hypothetical protein